MKMNDTNKTERSLKGNHRDQVHRNPVDLSNLGNLDELRESGEKIRDGVRDAKDAIGAKVDEIRKQMRAERSELSHKMNKYVHEKPLTALGLAALGGMIFAWLMRRK
jgi:ElaB/YqjD/DUF883 family membrane-anchored ribosome-binding protein